MQSLLRSQARMKFRGKMQFAPSCSQSMDCTLCLCPCLCLVVILVWLVGFFFCLSLLNTLFSMYCYELALSNQLESSLISKLIQLRGASKSAFADTCIGFCLLTVLYSITVREVDATIIRKVAIALGLLTPFSCIQHII